MPADVWPGRGPIVRVRTGEGGVAIGPATPGFVADLQLSSQLAEIGVMLLMFGVGLHFSLDDLLAVRKIALPGALVQIVAATLMGAGLATWWGWNLGAALVFGLALSVASTVVLLRALENLGLLESHTGRIAVGWLVVEDLAMVLVLVLLPPLAGVLGGRADGVEGEGASLWRTLGITMLQVGGFLTLMLVVGRRVFPWLLWQVTRTGSRELFTLCVVAAAVSIAQKPATSAVRRLASVLSSLSSPRTAGPRNSPPPNNTNTTSTSAHTAQPASPT